MDHPRRLVANNSPVKNIDFGKLHLPEFFCLEYVFGLDVVVSLDCFPKHLFGAEEPVFNFIG